MRLFLNILLRGGVFLGLNYLGWIVLQNNNESISLTGDPKTAIAAALIAAVLFGLIDSLLMFLCGLLTSVFFGGSVIKAATRKSFNMTSMAADFNRIRRAAFITNGIAIAAMPFVGWGTLSGIHHFWPDMLDVSHNAWLVVLSGFLLTIASLPKSSSS